MKKIILSTILTSLLLGLVSPVTAQSGITLSPFQYETNIEPGGSFSTSFSLTNDSNVTADVSLSLAEYQFGSNPSLILTPDEEGVTSWITLSATELEVVPERQSVITIDGQVPLSVEAGAYLPIVIITWENQKVESPTSSASVNPSFAFKIYLNVAGEKSSSTVEVSQFESAQFILTDNLSLNYAVTNIADVFIKPIGYLQLLDRDDHPVAKELINEAHALISPNESIAARAEFSLSSAGIFLPGKYEVELLVLDLTWGNSVTVSTSFWYLPWWIIVGGLVLIGGFVYIHKRYKAQAPRLKTYVQS